MTETWIETRRGERSNGGTSLNTSHVTIIERRKYLNLYCSRAVLETVKTMPNGVYYRWKAGESSTLLHIMPSPATESEGYTVKARGGRPHLAIPLAKVGNPAIVGNGPFAVEDVTISDAEIVIKLPFGFRAAAVTTGRASHD